MGGRPRGQASPGGWRAVAGWVLYDLGNTVFSNNIVSLYFPLWVVGTMGGRDGDYALAASLAMGLVFVSAPLLGAVSDQVPRRLPLLVTSTLLCCAFTALLGTGGLLASLLLFVAANYCYQVGLVFYDALLPVVSTEANRGRIGGLGIGVGYLGSLLGIGVGLAVLHADPDAKPLVFRLSALLFLVFALPCFAWVREPVRPDAVHDVPGALRRALGDLRATAARLRRYPDLARFLVGRVFYADAANTMIAFMGIYAVAETGLSETQVQLLLGTGIIAAVVGGLAWGSIVDRLGPKRTLSMVLGVWALVLTLTAAVAFLRLPRELFWLIAPLAGLALGGTWAADRPYMLRLTPPRHVGQFYGLYAMAGRFAAIMGPLLWALIVDGLGWGRPAAVLSLVAMVALAAVILRPVSDQRRAWLDEERLAAPVASAGAASPSSGA